MGAIAGIIYSDIFGHTKEIEPMLISLMHRGCENPQTYVYHEVQLGCCGCHLFIDEKKGLLVGLDGSLTNEKELRAELLNQGYRFPQGGVPELLAAAYEAWKEEFLKKLRGEFAFFLFDIKKERLLLARDPIGKKPLYWISHHNTFLFASELKAILASGVVAPSPSNESLAAYLFLGYIPQDMTPIADVSKLLPGYCLLIEKDRSYSILPYWSYSSFFLQQKQISHKDALEQFSSLLVQATRRRIPEERPVGTTLSGGLGSGTITYLLQTLLPKEQIRALTVGFEGQYEEDIDSASAIAQALQIPHETMRITPSTFMDSFLPMIWYLDEPLADPNIVATWHIGTLAQKQTQTVFSGMGSDELLAGHMRYSLPPAQDTWQQRLSSLLQGAARAVLLPLLIRFDKADAYTLSRRLRVNPWQYEYVEQNALFKRKVLESAAPIFTDLFDPRVFLNKFYHISRVSATASSFLYFDVKTRLADWYIMQYERSMNAHNIKWETPFLDLDIVEFLASLHAPDLASPGGKPRFLEEILPAQFPSFVKKRPKITRKNFLAPWAGIAPLAEIFPILRRGVLVSTGIISDAWLEEVTATREAMVANFRYLWGILVLEVWFRLFVHGPVRTLPPEEMPLKDFLLEG